MKSRALAYEDSNMKNITQYRKNYLRYSNRPFTTTTLTELNRSILSSNFILVGDFHTFDHCLKNLIRILKLLVLKNKKVVVALEMLSGRDFLLLDSFLKGHLTELEFLESINLGNSWKFPWTHYRSIFEFVRIHPQIEIIGVNTIGSLNKRDSFCAEVLANKWLEEPDKTFVVLYGEYHLAANKIPQKLNDYLDIGVKITTIHQNLDAPYWKLLKKNKPSNQQMVIKYKSNEFCLLTSPPWMKYESMCYWYENLYDDPEYDLHQYIIENGLKLLSSNTIDNFELLTKQLLYLFKLKTKDENLSFNLYDFTKIDYLKKIIKTKYKNPKTKKLINQLCDSQFMLILPGTDKVYCASYSSNKLLKLAGGFLYLEQCKSNNTNITNLYETYDKKELFSHWVLYFFHAYFMAKAINPYLKCDLFSDHYKMAAKSKPSRLLVAIFDHPDDLNNFLLKIKHVEVFNLAKMIGELIAETHFVNFHLCAKNFNPIQWKNDYLKLPTKIETIIDLIHEVKKTSGFKNQKKRYY